jgi:hypothetical protein
MESNVENIHHLYIYIYIVTCYPGSQPIQRFIARRQLCKYATILQALLGRCRRTQQQHRRNWKNVSGLLGTSTLNEGAVAAIGD